MKNQNNKFVTFLLALFCSYSFGVGIEGIYTGQMKLKLDDKNTTVPLQLALTNTGETVVVQTNPQIFEEQLVIDGAILIDDEGGPYGIGSVNYNLDLSEIDLRYNRRDATLGQVPASFRLDGFVDLTGAIRGRVISGIGGVIGTFELKRTALATLKLTNKYQGVWSGEGESFPGGPKIPIEIGMGISKRPQINPMNYEFFYTPGKFGYLSWKYVKGFFGLITIDYLRRKIIFSDSVGLDAGGVTAVCDLDEATGDLIGTLYGVNQGQIATFRLKKIR